MGSTGGIGHRSK